MTCIDGGFPGSDRHVGGVGHQCSSLHDALSLPIHLHGQLSVRQHCQNAEQNSGPKWAFLQPHTSGKSRRTSDISLPRSPQPT